MNSCKPVMKDKLWKKHEHITADRNKISVGYRIKCYSAPGRLVHHRTLQTISLEHTTLVCDAEWQPNLHSAKDRSIQVKYDPKRSSDFVRMLLSIHVLNSKKLCFVRNARASSVWISVCITHSRIFFFLMQLDGILFCPYTKEHTRMRLCRFNVRSRPGK